MSGWAALNTLRDLVETEGVGEDALALVQAALEAAVEADTWNPQTERALEALHPQHRAAIKALREALSRLGKDTA